MPPPGLLPCITTFTIVRYGAKSAGANDNNVYTELAHPGAIELPKGKLMMLFAGEQPSLDNSLTEDSWNAPRDIGMLIMSANLNGTIYSDGPVETGGWYHYYGGSPRPHIVPLVSPPVTSHDPTLPRRLD